MILREHVMRRGLRRRRDADRAIHATLASLGAYLDEPEARLVCDALPGELKPLLERHAFDARLDPNGFFDDVATAERAPALHAREHAEIVCAALAEVLPNESRARLVKELPAPLGALFELAPSVSSPPHATHHDPRHHTLATGEPGSLHPVAESAPRAAAENSVARPNPHAETKLSSAHGLTQDDLHESLATTTEPSDDRSIARSRE